LQTYNMKTGDTKPMRVQLTYSDGTPVNLTGATATFFMGTTIAAGAATVVDGPGGLVEYPWLVGQTAVAGKYPAEFRINIGGATQRVPSRGTLTVVIADAVPGT